MTIRRSLDQWYNLGLRDGAAGKPPDPFVVSSRPGVVHRDNRHFRRAYTAGWHDGQDVDEIDLGFQLQGELPKRGRR